MEVITVSSPVQGLLYFPFRQKLLKKSLKPAPESQFWLFYRSVTLDV